MSTAIPPRPSLLNGLRQANLTWNVALAELIDNAFDAGATRAEISFGPGKQVQVGDDGNGCPSPLRMLTLGDHVHQSSTKLGRYGVGLKTAACWLWGIVDIETTHHEMTRKLTLDWGKLAKQDTWEIPDILEHSANGRRGTKIRLHNIARGIPSDYNRLVDDLAYLFTPGLLQGKQIRFSFPRKPPRLAYPYDAPPCEDIVEESFSVGGKGVKLRAGIVKEGIDNTRAGFAYCHHHRIILPGTSLGAGDYSISRIVGYVLLDDSWVLSTHKDDINELKEELGREVFVRCREMLGKAERQASTIASRAFDETLSAMMRKALLSLATKRKEKRKPPQNETGTIEPTDSGNVRKRASRTQPGDKLLSEDAIGKLTLDWKAFDDETLGDVDRGTYRIFLNQRNEYLCRLRREENKAAILCAAIGMYVRAALESDKPQLFLPGLRFDGTDQRFNAMWAKVLARIEP